MNIADLKSLLGLEDRLQLDRWDKTNKQTNKQTRKQEKSSFPTGESSTEDFTDVREVLVYFSNQLAMDYWLLIY